MRKIIVPILLIIGGILMILGFSLNREKSGFVHTDRLLMNFKGYIEAQNKYLQQEQISKIRIDSLIQMSELEINQLELENTERNSRLYELQNNLNSLKASEAQRLQMLDESATTQVLNQLNQFVKEYGEEKGFDFIFGSTDDGSLMYSADQNDITEEVLEYVNQKYER